MKSFKLWIVAVLIVFSSAFALSGRRALISEDPVDNLKGKIVKVDRSNIVVQDDQAIPRSFRVNETTNCIIDGREAPTKQLVVGYQCLLTSRDGKIATAITAFNSNASR